MSAIDRRANELSSRSAGTLWDPQRKLLRLLRENVKYHSMVHSTNKRTDGMMWGPSRIQDNFLVYLQLDSKLPVPKESKYNRSMRRTLAIDGKLGVIGSKGSMIFKPNGLLKRTISARIDGYTLTNSEMFGM